MLRLTLAAGLMLAAAASAHAACTSEDVVNKTSAVSDVLMEKISSKPDAGSKLMQEMGEITSVSPPTAETCTKLDALLVRAKAL